MKMCQAIAKLGHDVLLIAINRIGEMETDVKDIYHFYNVEKCFKIDYIDYAKTNRKINSQTYRRYLKYKLKAKDHLLFRNSIFNFIRKYKPDLVFGRNLIGCDVATIFGHKTIFEAHKPITKEIFKKMLFQMVGNKKFIKFIVITKRLQMDFLKNGLTESVFSILPDGSDEVEDFKIKKYIGGKNILKVGYVGHLYKGKGLEIIRQIAPILNDIDFHIIGGSEKDVNYWKKTINLSNVIFHGFIPQYDLAKYINPLDICLLPNRSSVYPYKKSGDAVDIGSYTSPLKMFEYMAYKKPIIASDLPVLREVLNATTAMLVPKDNISEWVKAINKLRDIDFRKEIAENAYNDFIRNYTWKKRAEKILSMI